MGRRIPHIAVVFALTLAAVLAAPVSAQTADDDYQPINWQSSGDSYSSGEGVFGNVGECAQSDQAYGPRAASALAQEWAFDSITFTACTGHVTEDFFIARGDKGSLWDWSVRVEELEGQGGPARVDIIALSFGGNDIGFGGMLKDCLDIPVFGGWDDFLQVGDIRTGCDLSEEEARLRVDALLDPPEACTGSRATGTAGYGCDLDLGTRRGSLIDAYYDIVTDRLTPHGRLYVVGYPRLVAPVSEWPGWVKVDCQEILRGDSEKLGRLADHLDTKLREAVDRANQALGESRVVFVDRLNHFRENKAELCGTNDDWINGLAVDRGEGINLRPRSSFHINADGHAATAGRLVERVRATFSRQPTVRCGASSAHGVSYQLPAVGEWQPVESGRDEPGVFFVGAPIGISSVQFQIRQGHLIDDILRRDGVESVEVEVPGATRAVRYDAPASDTGDGLAVVELIEAGEVTIEAVTYTYIEDLDRFTPDDLQVFLDSLCVDPDALPVAQTSADEVVVEGYEAVVCGLVTSAFDTEVLVVRPRGGIDCTEAIAVIHRYLNDTSLDYQGSSASATFEGWSCASTSGAHGYGTGRAGSCGSLVGEHTIVMCSPESNPGSDGMVPDELCVAALQVSGLRVS